MAPSELRRQADAGEKFVARSRGAYVRREPEPDDPSVLAGDCADGTCEHQVRLSRVLRDLHDEVGSSLAGVLAQLELTGRLMHSDTDRAKRMINDLHFTTTDLVTAVRRMSVRQCDTYRPRSGAFGGTGRGANYAEALQTMIGRIQAVVGDRLEITLRLEPEVEDVAHEVGWAAFWIINEALTNVLRHSRAQHCLVAVWIGSTDLHVQVEDDGIGADAVANAGGDAGIGGSGVGNMADRAAELGGWCTVQPSIPNGVVVLAALPLAGAGRG